MQPAPHVSESNAKPLATVEVSQISPRYVFTMATFALRAPVRNLANSAAGMERANPNSVMEIAVPSVPIRSVGRRPKLRTILRGRDRGTQGQSRLMLSSGKR